MRLIYGKGTREIDSTLVRIDANGSNFNMLATTSMPTKNGMMRLDVTSAMQAAAESDSSLRTLSSLVSWKVDAKRDFSGSIGFDLFCMARCGQSSRSQRCDRL